MVIKMTSTLDRAFKQVTKPKLAPGMKKLGWSIAEAIRERVRDRGQLVDQTYTPKSKGRWTTTEYAIAAGVSGGQHIGDTNAIAVRTRDLKRGKTKRSFSNSGGMWDRGLQVVRRGSHNVAIVFRGRSLGAVIKWKPKKLAIREGEDGEKFARRVKSQKTRFINQHGQERRAAPLRESNALKAWTVLNKAKVNVLRLHAREVAAISNALVVIQRAALERMFTGRAVWTQSMVADDRKLRAKLLAGEGVNRP